jgi:hypothetical protein
MTKTLGDRACFGFLVLRGPFRMTDYQKVKRHGFWFPFQPELSLYGDEYCRVLSIACKETVPPFPLRGPPTRITTVFAVLLAGMRISGPGNSRRWSSAAQRWSIAAYVCPTAPYPEFGRRLRV